MIPSISRLIGADEFLNHQIANTHASVGTADRSWTEKIWFTLMRKDATLQASFGFGKYTNRNIIDGFAGIQRGTQQRTIRASRVLNPRIDEMAVGPLNYEVIEPFRKLRLTVAQNSVQPFAYDLTFTSDLPAFFEKRDVVLAGGRTASDVIRYHQGGTVEGWIDIEGERTQVNPDDWYGFRDHSWGIREHVGLDPADLVPGDLAATAANKSGSDFHFNWMVSHITRPDGSSYELAYYFRDFGGDGPPQFLSGHINESDGRQTPILHLYPEMTYRKSDKAAMHGRIHVFVAGKGREIVERIFEVEAINSDMGFRLLPGMYGSWKGAIHGSFKGADFLDGE
jgi:hypothetical protein